MQLTKDNSFIQALEYLQEHSGMDCFQIEDYWIADMCAIGLTDKAGKYLFHLSTYTQKPDIYDIASEEKINPQPTKVVFANATRDQMQEVFKNYFLREPN